MDSIPQAKGKIGAANHFEAAFMLVLFCLPLGNKLVSNLAMFLLVLNCLFFLKRDHWKMAFRSPLFWAPAAFFALHVLSLIYTQNIEQGLRGLETKLSFLLAPLLIVASRPWFTSSARFRLLIAFSAGVLAACLWALGNAAWLAWQEGAWFYDLEDGLGRRYYFVYTHLAKPIMHPGYFSTYLGFALFCVLALWQYFKVKWPLLAAMVFFFCMMLLLQGRINLMAFFLTLGMAALGLAIKRRAFIWLIIPLVPIALLAGVLTFTSSDFSSRYFQWPNLDYDISGNEFNSATYRLAEWRCAAQVIAEQPLLGTGFGDQKDALLKAYQDHQFWAGLKHRYNAHNQYLETTMALGFTGLLFLLILLGLYLKIAWQQKNYLVVLCLVFFSLCMLTESMWVRAWAVLLFNAFIPLFLTVGSVNGKVSGRF